MFSCVFTTLGEKLLDPVRPGRPLGRNRVDGHLKQMFSGKGTNCDRKFCFVHKSLFYGDFQVCNSHFSSIGKYSGRVFCSIIFFKYHRILGIKLRRKCFIMINCLFCYGFNINIRF